MLHLYSSSAHSHLIMSLRHWFPDPFAHKPITPTNPSRHPPTHLLTVHAANPKSLEAHSLMVMDMGQHVVQDLAQPLTLHQILVPGLEDRARAFPPLSTARQLSPGTLPGPCCIPPALCAGSFSCCGALCSSLSYPGFFAACMSRPVVPWLGMPSALYAAVYVVPQLVMS